MSKSNLQEINYRNNAFDLLKIIAAFIVVFSHSFRHFGIEKASWTLFFTDGSVGVILFFAITGFVMMPAWEKMENKMGGGIKTYFSFLYNRVLRLYPPLWISFLIISVTNMVIFNIDLFSFSYLVYAIKYCIFANGAGFGSTGIANGVLWTIMADIIFYIIAPFIYKLMKNQKTWVWLLVIFAFWQFNIWDAQVVAFFQSIPFIGRFVSIDFSLCFIYEFLIGCFLYFKRNTIISFFVNNKIWAYIWLMGFIVFFQLYNYYGVIPQTGLMHSPWLGIIVAPLSIILGFVIGNVKIKYEMSYSIFLYHMVVIAILKAFGVTGVMGIILTICITPIVAFISRILIEMPMLKFKEKKKNLS